ncbi:FxsA family protein [Phytohabitans sp. ZYX-F-186]|uniref:FxsA family protein n=1 Tax=Phytohabitans maris TaxID=3071409 RepID=A0ABU0ZIJ9_9ACTN|nr:FxsA family protein [Phytohabitans sp. ZYX-F-186]MDQ7906197.1 FxsA family protein [Phytohabitans sp. ZYX-F-186]
MGRAIALGVPLVAIAEIVVFVLVGTGIGYGWALLAVLAASFLGMMLLRREGMRAWRGFIAAANAGQHPGERVIDGIVGLGAGVLLTVPGFLTALAGLLLLTPPARSVARRGVQRWTERRVSAAVAGDLFGPRKVKVQRGAPDTDDAIEGEIV